MSLNHWLLLGSLVAFSAFAKDRTNPAPAPKTTKAQAEAQKAIGGATTQTPVQPAPLKTPSFGGVKAPEDIMNVKPNAGGNDKAAKAAAPENHAEQPNQATTGRAEIDLSREREVETFGRLSPEVINRVQFATREGMMEAANFDQVTGKLKSDLDELAKLEAKKAAKTITADEEARLAELTKVKLELADMLKAQAELDGKGKGSPPAELLKSLSKISDAVNERMADIKKTVAELRAQGKVIPQEAVDNLMRNIIDTYAGRGFQGGKKGSEALGLKLAFKNLTGLDIETGQKVSEPLKGEQLVGMIKYLDSYGSAFRKYRGDGDTIETAHKKAAAVRRKFIAERAALAREEALRNPEALEEALRSCTGT